MIQKLHLTSFRNFSDKLLQFSSDTTVIVGPNASGKTNILESVYLIATGKSFKARVEEEMINYDQEISRVKGKINDDTLELVLTRGVISLGTKRTEATPRKRLLVNGTGKRLLDFAAHLKVVLFSPSDLDLVTESPSHRRRFLDAVLSQVDREYYRASLSYDKGLRQRNKLLYRIREEGLPRHSLLFWDRLLIKNGDYLSRQREKFIEYVNSQPDFDGQDFSIEYDRSAISESRLQEYAAEEVAAATTLVGPHRDDFFLLLKKTDKARDLARYGSRGEARMGVLWLKLAELSYLEAETSEKPTLLLDDIFSELDHPHRKIVMDTTKNQQTIITTADPHFISDFKNIEVIRLN